MPTPRAPSSNDPQRSPFDLDATDRAILELLAHQARMPNNAIASKVGIAPSTCLLRIRRLEQSGTIRRYRAELAPEALGRPIQAMVSVRIQPQSRHRIGTFTQQFSRLPGVMNVYFLSGGDDFLLQVAVETPADLRTFVVDNLSASSDVAATETSLIFDHVSTGAGLT